MKTSKISQLGLRVWLSLSLFVQACFQRMKLLIAKKKFKPELPTLNSQPVRANNKRRVIRMALFVAIGTYLAAICHTLPEEYQAPCAATIKLLSVIFGGG